MNMHIIKMKTDFIYCLWFMLTKSTKRTESLCSWFLFLLSSFWDIFRLSALLPDQTEHVKETATVTLHRQRWAMTVVAVRCSYYAMTEEQCRLIIVSPTIRSTSWEANWLWLCHLIPAFNLCARPCRYTQL